MENLLQQVGLNEVQAKTYLYLLGHGESAPPQIAKAINLTRSNAYKVLEKLHDMQLIDRSEVRGKFVYGAKDPIVLTRIVAEERNRLTSLEHDMRDAMQVLRSSYEESTADKEIEIYRGDQAVSTLCDQLGTAKVLSITSRKTQPLGSRQIKNAVHIVVDSKDSTTPVEWTVSDDELMIFSFEQEASVIRIRNKLVARAFKELWHLIDTSVRKDPNYKKPSK